MWWQEQRRHRWQRRRRRPTISHNFRCRWFDFNCIFSFVNTICSHWKCVRTIIFSFSINRHTALTMAMGERSLYIIYRAQCCKIAPLVILPWHCWHISFHSKFQKCFIIIIIWLQWTNWGGQRGGGRESERVWDDESVTISLMCLIISSLFSWNIIFVSPPLPAWLSLTLSLPSSKMNEKFIVFRGRDTRSLLPIISSHQWHCLWPLCRLYYSTLDWPVNHSAKPFACHRQHETCKQFCNTEFFERINNNNKTWWPC